MPNETLVIAPKSADVSYFNVKDGDGQPIDFEDGTWVAHMEIRLFPGPGTVPIYDWTSTDGDLTFELGRVVLHWDPSIEYTFTRGHFDLYIKGPNANSPEIRIDHGPVQIDF
jgi:hypothetical protein